MKPLSVPYRCTTGWYSEDNGGGRIRRKWNFLGFQALRVDGFLFFVSLHVSAVSSSSIFCTYCMLGSLGYQMRVS